MFGAQVDAALLPTGSEDAWVKFCFMRGVSTGNSILYIRADDTNDFGAGAGPDLSSTWETSTVAITLRASHGDVVIPGPEHWSTSDIEEPYAGVLPTDTRALVQTWLDNLPSGASVTLILDDGVSDATDITLRAQVSTGTPRILAQLDVTPPDEIELRARVSTGTPRILAQLNITPPIELRAQVSTGTPRILARLSLTPPIELRAQVSTGTPRILARLSLTPPIKLRARISTGTPRIRAQLARVSHRSPTTSTFEPAFQQERHESALNWTHRSPTTSTFEPAFQRERHGFTHDWTS